MTQQSKDILQLARNAKALADKATPGPWQRAGGVPPTVLTQHNCYAPTFPENRINRKDDGSVASWYLGVCKGNERTTDWEGEWNDLEFIAAARSDVPALADAVLTMAAELSRVHHEKEDALDRLARTEENVAALKGELEGVKALWRKTITGNQHLTGEVDRLKAELAVLRSLDAGTHYRCGGCDHVYELPCASIIPMGPSHVIRLCADCTIDGDKE
jgi:hypothetical protein